MPTLIRARDLGIPFDGAPGPWNAITDVAGVAVGHVTLIAGDGPLVVGSGPVRTGVTAITPRTASQAPVFAGWFSLNGNGEMTGTAWIEESGLLESPILLTNTHSVGVARDACIAWMLQHGWPHDAWYMPVVAETYDGWLNDVNGFHVRQEHVLDALDSAHSGPVEEGSVGGGTGMVCHGFKGGIGTASRRVPCQDGTYTVGALVQANHGAQRQLHIAGLPVGLELAAPEDRRQEQGSIIIVLATDAPLLPHQAKALARRATMGLARTGSVSGIHSGDLFLAFSTANLQDGRPLRHTPVTLFGLNDISLIFEAAVQAAEEAIVNALVAGQTMTGVNGHTVPGLPHDRVRAILARHHLLQPSSASGP